jgi:Ca2+-binding RTX toxin-like protein
MTTGVSGNLIQNGSFEEFDAAASVNNASWWGVRSLAGWNLEGVQKDKTNWFEVVNSGQRGINSTSGTHWLDMDAAGTPMAINQTVQAIEAGKTYTLSVKLASSSYGEGVDIYWGGVKLANIVPTSVTMETVTFTVTGSADAAQNTLRLVGTGSANGVGVAIDDISLVKNADGFAPDDAPEFYINAIHEGTSDAQYFEVGTNSGRQFVNNFDVTEDRIRVRSDLATSWADLQTKSVIYQSGASTVVEFHNDSEVFVLTQFQASKLGVSSFIFDVPAASAVVTGANLVRNGSFEVIGNAARMGWGVASTTLDGWTLAGTARSGSNWFEVVSTKHRGVDAAEGKYWLDMDASSGNIGISQNIAGVEAGRYYTMSFNAAASTTGNSVDVFWAGSKIGTVTPDGKTMQSFSFVVEGYADVALNKLSFNSVGVVDGIGVSLDNVRMFAHQGIIETPDVFSFGLGSGRLYVTDFQIGFDSIVIKADLVSNFDELMSEAAVYQDGRATIIEFNNGRESIVLPQFDMNNLSPEMFTFSKPLRSGEMMGVESQLNGTEKDDTIIAGAGSQTIDGSAGFDILTGGLGADSFIYNAKSGHDFITDFNGAEDRIVMSMDLVKSFDHLLEVGAIYQDGKSTQVEIGEGQLITLYGVDAKTVTADWFVFA